MDIEAKVGNLKNEFSAKAKVSLAQLVEPKNRTLKIKALATD